MAAVRNVAAGVEQDTLAQMQKMLERVREVQQQKCSALQEQQRTLAKQLVAIQLFLDQVSHLVLKTKLHMCAPVNRLAREETCSAIL